MDIANSVFLSLGTWTWFALGLVLMALELIVPGTFMLWFGIAAIATGMVALAVGLSWQAQIAVFAIFAVLSLVAWWKLRGRVADGPGDPVLNRRAERHVGRRFVLAEPIVSGVGRVKLDDTVWRIEGADTPAGTPVEVVAVDGSVLRVTPVTN